MPLLFKKLLKLLKLLTPCDLSSFPVSFFFFDFSVLPFDNVGGSRYSATCGTALEGRTRYQQKIPFP